MNELQTYVQSPEEHLDELLRTDPRLQSDYSRRAYKWGIKGFLAWLDGKPITKTSTLEYLAHLQELGRAPNYINLCLASTKWYTRRLADLAQDYCDDPAIADEFTKRANRILEVRAMKVDQGRAGRLITPGEFASILDVCRKDKRPAGKRDLALFAVLWVTGARNAELAHMKMCDMKRTPEGFTIEIVRGKGNKSRPCYLHGGAARYMEDWLKVRGEGEGYIFTPLDRKPHGEQGPMCRQSVVFLVARRCKEAGITDITTTHDFRRSFCSGLLGSGIDITTVQRLMGHESVATTGRYDRRPIEQGREAVKVLAVPYYE